MKSAGALGRGPYLPAMPEMMLWAVMAVLFVGTFVRTAFGFGEALIAVPLLALIMPVELAAPIAVLVSITVACVVLVTDWRHVEFRSALHLVGFTLLGIPLGLLLLLHVPEAIVKALLGTMIASFSCYCLFSKKRARLKNNRLAWVFGTCAGVLGGAYGVNGPPIVVYGALRQWPPERFRATMQGYFLPTSIGILIGYWSAGLWVPAVTHYFLIALPVIAVAIFAGKIAGRRLNGPKFFVFVHSGLILAGTSLLLQAFF